MELARYRELLAHARRVARSPDDAQDLAQEVLLAALAAGRDDLPWLVGTVTNLAAMQARGAARRRRREGAVHDTTADTASDVREPAPPTLALPAMPPAARRVAVLALHGLAADEIRWILDLTPTAFRQRLTSIRRAIDKLPEAQRREALALAYVRDPARSVDLQFGLVRRALKAALTSGGPGLATHDTDGHLLVLRTPAHGSAPRGNE